MASARSLSVGRSHILYDADVVHLPEEKLFDPEYWRKKGAIVGHGDGRGAALFVRSGAETWVLRHYHRGGWAAKVLGDRYLTFAIENSRPWREFRLTAQLHKLGLPVPSPIAARICGLPPFRRGDLITRLIANTETLASVLKREPLATEKWSELGRMLRRFHDAGLLHHDINARNILIDEGGHFYLIDLDKGQLAKPGKWQEQTRLRLRRSLRKFARLEKPFHFSDADWQVLTAGYQAGRG